MVETERKFLLKSDAWRQLPARKSHIVQGYLSTDPERTVRVRIRGESGTVTIKGKSSASGMSRYEWETEISLHDAKSLILLCIGVVDKTRHEIPFGSHVFEVDEFHGNHDGLVLAEVELKSENEDFPRPDWLGDEVTQDVRYYNSWLSANPWPFNEPPRS